MDAIDKSQIQELLNRIKALVKVLQDWGEEGRNRLGRIKVDKVLREVPKDANDKLDAEAWSKLDAEEQMELYRELAFTLDSLCSAVGLDGPADPKHIMHPEYASNAAIILWAVAGFLLTAALLYSVVWYWDKATGTDMPLKVKTAIETLDDLDRANADVADTSTKIAALNAAPKDPNAAKKLRLELTARRTEVSEIAQDVNSTAVEAVKAIRKGGATETSVLLMVLLLGGLGGSLHFLRSLVTFVGTRRLKRSWLLYYLSTPFSGAGLAPIVYMMLRVGLINPSGTSVNGSAVTNVNLIAIYAFAILTGLFARTAMDKMGEVFKTLFSTQHEPGDKAGSERPPGGKVTSTGGAT